MNQQPITATDVEPCGCEHTRHFDDEFGPQAAHDYLAVPAGEQTAAFIGKVCDVCATECMANYLVESDESTIRSIVGLNE